ncbi:hypothetical protein NQZ68_037140 [Dissostichus eleginoides]|nr:hypothetical protein NQZ68_037140 [Dissostichus eleginoides]
MPLPSSKCPLTAASGLPAGEMSSGSSSASGPLMAASGSTSSMRAKSVLMSPKVLAGGFPTAHWLQCLYNETNKRLQGVESNIMQCKEVLDAFVRKLEYRVGKMERGELQQFPLLLKQSRNNPETVPVSGTMGKSGYPVLTQVLGRRKRFLKDRPRLRKFPYATPNPWSEGLWDWHFNPTPAPSQRNLNSIGE